MIDDTCKNEASGEGGGESPLALLLRNARPERALFFVRADDRSPAQISQQVADVCLALETLPGERIAEPSLGRLKVQARMMARDGHARGDPIREIHALLGERWSPLVLDILHIDCFRFTTLHKLMTVMCAEQKVSPKVITVALRDLERDGLVERMVAEGKPSVITYRLTAFGHDLVEQVNRLRQCIREHAQTIRAARQRFAAQQGNNEPD